MGTRPLRRRRAGRRGPNQISFVEVAAKRSMGRVSRRLVADRASGFRGHRTLIRANQPRAAFAAVVKLLYPLRRSGPVASDGGDRSRAQVDGSAEIGPRTVIESGARGGGLPVRAGSFLAGEGSSLGTGSVVYPNVTIYSGVTIGARAVLLRLRDWRGWLRLRAGGRSLREVPADRHSHH